MGNKIIGRGFVAALALAGSFGLTASIAAADDCGYTPPGTRQVQHDAITKQVPRVIPGQKAEGYDVFRYKREIAPVPAEAVTEAQYYKVVKGTPKLTETYWQHWRMNPGQRQQLEEQLKRWNEGQKETYTQYFKYFKIIPGNEGVKTFEWQRTVKEYCTEYQYEKWVKGTKEKKVYGKWVPDGTFDYRDWPGAGPVWNDGGSGGHHDVWVEGDTRYTSTAYKYVKTGVTREVEIGNKKETKWSTSSPGDDWTKTGKWEWEIKPTPDQKVWYKNGDWTKEELGSTWQVADTKKEANGDAVAPFWEYKTREGWSKNLSDADWFPAGKYDGTTFNTREVQKEIPPFKEWRDGDGNATTDPTQAGWSLKKEIDGWNTGDSEERTIKEATPDMTYYLVLNTDGSFTKTTDPTQASWIDVKVEVQSYWKQLGDTRTRETKPAEEGYTEYYVYGGAPTRVLGESNWVKEAQIPDAKDGWKFVDEKFHETKAAIPPKTVYDIVVVKKAWIEYIKIPARYTECNDRGVGAKTGGEDPAGTATAQADYTGAWVGGGALVLGLAALYGARRRKASQV